MLPLVITVAQVDGGMRRYAFADSPVTIGRSPFAELQLSEPFISRWEGTLRFDERDVTYFSLGATNSTHLDGQRIVGEEDITLGIDSVLALGDLTLRFSREPVPESDLRRKGKRRPIKPGADMGVKTVYLDAADAWAPAPPPPPPRAPNKHPTTVVNESPAPSPLARLPKGKGLNGHKTVGIAGGKATSGLDSLRTSYRNARSALLLEIEAELGALPEGARGDFLSLLIRLEPTLGSDPGLQSELQRAGVTIPTEIPELRDWLRAIRSDILPGAGEFDSRVTLTRVLGLLEVLIQSLAEIHDAQDSVRRRWLGRSSRRSVLQSENGKVVLAYLLNPQADWSERMVELEQSVRSLVTHELALFRAVLEGARSLLHAVSPEVITQTDTDERDMEIASQPSLWARWFCKSDVQASGLWRRFTSLHAELVDGARYERVFLGRLFARSYLAAMGQRDATE